MDAARPRVNNSEYYAVLNVSKEATQEEIRRAYKQLASVCHPDKSTDPLLAEVRIYI
jgi:DnaJ-class molecular chaperone